MLHRFIAFLAATAALGAFAQSYPTRPITLIVPFSAGGPTDTLGRVMAEPFTRRQ